jgi:hypothetical protein
MAIPKYPPELTQAQWNTNKGLIAKASAGATGLGPLMLQCEALYKAVAWNKFDVTKVLAGGATGEQAQEGYKAAYNEFAQKVTPLVKKVTELHNKSVTIEATFLKSKLIPKSTTAYVTKVKTTSQLFAAQAQAVRGELDAFLTAASHPMVEDAVGTDWFLKLNRITFFKNSQVVNWTTNADLGLSAADDKPNSELKEVQADAKKEIAIFKDRVTKLNALKTKRFEKKSGIKQAATLWREASDAFFVMKPGLQGIVRTWAVTQSNLVKGHGGQERMNTWTHAHAAAFQLHQAVERILHEQEPLLNSLDEHIDNIAR